MGEAWSSLTFPIEQPATFDYGGRLSLKSAHSGDIYTSVTTQGKGIKSGHGNTIWIVANVTTVRAT